MKGLRDSGPASLAGWRRFGLGLCHPGQWMERYLNRSREIGGELANALTGFEAAD